MRYIAREVFNSLRADLAETQPQSRVATTIMCGTPGLGPRDHTQTHLTSIGTSQASSL
jgi:hypothetical protein